ncbi:MAG: ATP-dependent sacrificial sulfur transferase LarE [Candidatus Njordarchaeales archaeon]
MEWKINLEDVMRSLDEHLREKFRELIKWYKEIEGPVIVAFSGGVDSSVILATAALALGSDKVIAVTSTSPIHPEEDLEWAKKIASMLNVKHILIRTNELSDPNFVRNPPERCYYCKKNLIKQLKNIAKQYNAEAIVEGTNASDLHEHRPGFLALKEEGVKSPLAETGITKEEARTIARILGLPNFNRPSMACLASRIPYGEYISPERLRRIALAEKTIKELVGIRQLRVRDHGYIARIEVGRDERQKLFNEELMDKIAYELMKLGYKFVTLDLLGYRSGSLDTLLVKKIIPKETKMQQ